MVPGGIETGDYYNLIHLLTYNVAMQTGPYIAERLMPKILATCCARTEVEFRAFSDEWVLRLTKDTMIRWVVGYKFDLNGSAAGEVAQDKVATYIALNAAGIAVIPHYLVRSVSNELIHVQGLREELGVMPVVAKPLQGTAGRDVSLLNAVDDALDMIRHNAEPAWALAPYYDLQAEYRLILLDGEVLLAYEKTQPHDRDGLKLFNLSLGAVAVDIEDIALLEDLTNMGRRVMRVMALRLAAVDVVRTPDGGLKVLEVNDGINMEHYARQSDETKQRTVAVYEAIIIGMFR
jgi:glutathione synthase/RimK-type ligase-like ATP-grasp enzyme